MRGQENAPGRQLYDGLALESIDAAQVAFIPPCLHDLQIYFACCVLLCARSKPPQNGSQSLGSHRLASRFACGLLSQHGSKYWGRKYYFPLLREYEVKNLRCPACSRLENATFSPHITHPMGSNISGPSTNISFGCVGWFDRVLLVIDFAHMWLHLYSFQ